MWIENVNTGHKWFVSEEYGERLLKSDDYKKVEEEKAAPKRQKQKRDVDEESK